MHLSKKDPVMPLCMLDKNKSYSPNKENWGRVMKRDHPQSKHTSC